MDLEPGRIRLRGASRHFRILHDRNLTLKETVLRRRRTTATEKWALREVDLDIVFDVAPEAMWETAIRRLGADPSTLTTSHGVH